MKSEYCSAKSAESIQKQLTILSDSQKIDFTKVVLAILLDADSLPICKNEKSKESQNGWVSRFQLQKSQEKDVSFVS